MRYNKTIENITKKNKRDLCFVYNVPYIYIYLFSYTLEKPKICVYM